MNTLSKKIISYHETTYYPPRLLIAYYKQIISIVAAAAICSLTSCASIINGSSQPVSFGSTPPGATVTVDGQPKGTTPSTIPLERTKRGHIVRIEAPGYYPYETHLSANFSGWYVGNLLIGGLIGLALDPCTGAMWYYNDINTNLVPTPKTKQ